MNSIESVGSVRSADRASHTPGLPRVQPAAAKNNHGPKTSTGMAGAMQLSDDFLRQVMSEIGFVDIQAGSLDKIKAFVALKLAQEQEAEISLDSVTAAEVANGMGAQTTGDMDMALRILAHVDPARVAALLK